MNPLINAVVMVALCSFLQYSRLGAHLLAYGLASIGAYLLFVVWAGSSAPAGPARIHAFGEDLIGAVGLFQSALAFQNFFLPILKQHKSS